ncbi:hypothetical protein H9P43_000423 [Blastocladiella emersonii ATCC 22665]|nr:hypothetical protein H9P43_000416 [Blastocladiella emersonii ATCC 22665]KAI9188996.1 hypothetical protein H9P43_000423 [Blastocladiella emersonii ATCC 22665]
MNDKGALVDAWISLSVYSATLPINLYFARKFWREWTLAGRRRAGLEHQQYVLWVSFSAVHALHMASSAARILEEQAGMVQCPSGPSASLCWLGAARASTLILDAACLGEVLALPVYPVLLLGTALDALPRLQLTRHVFTGCKALLLVLTAVLATLIPLRTALRLIGPGAWLGLGTFFGVYGLVFNLYFGMLVVLATMALAGIFWIIARALAADRTRLNH